jgi:hypothetical protein
MSDQRSILAIHRSASTISQASERKLSNAAQLHLVALHRAPGARPVAPLQEAKAGYDIGISGVPLEFTTALASSKVTSEEDKDKICQYVISQLTIISSSSAAQHHPYRLQKDRSVTTEGCMPPRESRRVSSAARDATLYRAPAFDWPGSMRRRRARFRAKLVAVSLANLLNRLNLT